MALCSKKMMGNIFLAEVCYVILPYSRESGKIKHE